MDQPSPLPLSVQQPEVEAQHLLDQTISLQQSIAAEAQRQTDAWNVPAGTAGFSKSAINLAWYLALRRRDLTEMQAGLSALGLSSLGRCEAHVETSLAAVRAALARIAGVEGADFPSPTSFTEGHKTIAALQRQIFGEDPDKPLTRIMVTMPTESAGDADFVNRMIAAGADCARVNCAHDGPEAWSAMIKNFRGEAKKLGRDVRVAMDIAGPKIRIGKVLSGEKIRLRCGDHFILCASQARSKKMPVATLSPGALIEALKPDGEVLINDGKLAAVVVTRGKGKAELEVTRCAEKGMKLKPEKGVNLPGATLNIPALTQEDINNLDFITANADAVGFSFVQTVSDVQALVAELRKRCEGRKLPAIILKIETPLAVRNLPNLIVAAGLHVPVAVMIARGDLAVEIGLERLSEIQEEILWLCEAAQVPVIWATQVLENMLKDGLASRAETTDAAMGHRAECVMLNKGPHEPEAVAFLESIFMRMSRHQDKKSARLSLLKSWQLEQSDVAPKLSQQATSDLFSSAPSSPQTS